MSRLQILDSHVYALMSEYQLRKDPETKTYRIVHAIGLGFSLVKSFSYEKNRKAKSEAFKLWNEIKQSHQITDKK